MTKKSKMISVCDMTKCECEFAGTKTFNYGFMQGREDACYHPKIDSRQRALYTFSGRPRFQCPLGMPESRALQALEATNED